MVWLQWSLARNTEPSIWDMFQTYSEQICIAMIKFKIKFLILLFTVVIDLCDYVAGSGGGGHKNNVRGITKGPNVRRHVQHVQRKSVPHGETHARQ